MIDLGRFWTVPNLLSLSRVLISLPAALIIYRDGPLIWAVVLILAAMVTDLLDGWLARATDRITEWGKLLDPLCDKIAVALVGLAVLLTGRIPLWFALAVFGRDAIILAGSAVLARVAGRLQMSNWIGKTTAGTVAGTLMLTLLDVPGGVIELCLWISVGLMALSLGSYGARALELHRIHADAAV